MIYYLVNREYSNTMTSFLSSWGRNLKSIIEVIPYEKIFTRRFLLPGTYIFADIERLNPADAELAAIIWDALRSRWGEEIIILNHPTRSMRRFELLRNLYETGINFHNVYMLTNGEMPERYPVFLRNSNDHGGATSSLLYSLKELKDIIARMDDQGKSREDKLIVEFCNTSDADGLFKKKSSFFINGRIIHRHIFCGKNWQLKKPEIINLPMIKDELAFIESHEHEMALKEIFNLARIDYGRIDYGIKDGKVQVWEINTNPGVAGLVRSSVQDRREEVHRAFVVQVEEAFTHIENITGIVGRIENPACEITGSRKRKKLKKRFKRAFRDSFMPFMARSRSYVRLQFGELEKHLFTGKK